MRWLRVVAYVAACAGALPAAAAQQSIDLGSISGRVTDSSGAVLPGAQIAARHLDTNLINRAVADREGRFRLPYLRVGSYEIRISHDGFDESVHHLAVSAGSAFELPVTLTLGGLATNVTVRADVAVLDAARSQIAATVSETEVKALPMNGRNFLELALLVPGVAPANTGSTQLFPETSAVSGVSLSVASQRNLSNNFIVDGLSANDDAAALTGMTFSLDAIAQFQVVTSGAQAELGRALGGYVNVVTRSGTNVVRGTAYNYVRDDRLTEEHPLLKARLPMNQLQYGGSAGGPFLANRTFYFANVEQRRLDQSGLTTISAASVSEVNARLAAVGYPGPLIATGIYPNPLDSTNALAKLDHQVGGRAHTSVRYSLYDVGAENSRGAGGLSAPSASAGLDNVDHAVAASSTWTMSARTALETRAQVVHSDLRAPATDPTGPAVSIAGVAAFGTSSTSPTRRVNTLYQFVNSLSHQAGAHAVRVGADVLHNVNRITFPRAVRGAYTFASLASFLAGEYNNAGFTQTFGVPDVGQTNPNVSIYAQDEWKVGSRVTLNLGLRYDLQILDTVATDTNNVSPRIGIAWSPFEARRTLIRASAGLYYDRVPLRALANALLSAGNTTELSNLRQLTVALSPAQAGAPAFPRILPGVVPAVTPVNLTTMDRNLQNAHSRQASVELVQELGDGTSVAVGYQYLRGLDLLMSVNQNVPACVATGSNNGCRPNPNYGNNSQYSSVGDSNYHGLHASYIQRPARWGHYRIAYTFSKSMNNVGEFFFSSPIDPLDLSRDWGRSDDDQRHRLVISGALLTPMDPATRFLEQVTNGFQVSGSLQVYSAPPLNITSGLTTVQGTAARPIVAGDFIERNAGAGSRFLSLNLRVSRTFRLGGRAQLEALAEGFNLTNHLNVLARNTNFGPGAYPTHPSPAFDQVTAVSDPRSFQLGARFRF